jgi:outer membrane protein TolC
VVADGGGLTGKPRLDHLIQAGTTSNKDLRTAGRRRTLATTRLRTSAAGEFPGPEGSSTSEFTGSPSPNRDASSARASS